MSELLSTATSVSTLSAASSWAKQVRADFPFFQQNNPPIYLDSSASAQIPQCVFDAVNNYYSQHHANVHRGVHSVTAQATAAYEGTRVAAQHFLNAPDSRGIIFTSGTTDSINLLAHSYLQNVLQPGDEIILTLMEHHANIVPWQQVAQARGATIKVVPLLPDYTLDMLAYEELLNSKTRLVACTHVSNVLGTINPVEKITELAHAVNATVFIDGAQACPHMPVDVQAIGCDFYAFSAHKCYAPTGLGVLYGRLDLLESMPPYKTGGGMIETVSFANTTFAPVPARFEAGTPAISAAVGLHAALDYMRSWQQQEWLSSGKVLSAYAAQALRKIPGLQLYGHTAPSAAVFSFSLADIHPHDLGTFLDDKGIAVRVGHHCAMPLIEHLGLPALTRASLGCYNTLEDIDALRDALAAALVFFQVAGEG